MKDRITAYIESGILELYILDQVSAAEAEEVEQMAATFPAVRQELDAIRDNMEQYALAHAVPPRPLVKSLFLATIDYMERQKNGEATAFPPVLNQNSRLSDFATWLNRPDMVLPNTPESIFIKIIGYTPAVTTALVWLKDQTDNEVHAKEYERFLVAEGTCTITAGEEQHHLTPGDYFAVPLHTSHSIRVTSTQPCKVVLQRELV